MRSIRSSLILVCVATALHAQQTSGAAIVGVVRDTAARPIAGASITVLPGRRTAETDSAGQFRIDNLGADNYQVRARKLGYRPETWDVKLGKTGQADVKFDLIPTPRILDTIRVSADGTCPTTRNFETFLCRRQRPGGVFLEVEEIDERDKWYVAELFENIRGLRVDWRIGLSGPQYSVHTQRANGCINSLVDGREASPANPIPVRTSSLIALEIYVRPDSVPKELQRYTMPPPAIPRPGGRIVGTDFARSGRCVVIAYWTNLSPFGVSRAP